MHRRRVLRHRIGAALLLAAAAAAPTARGNLFGCAVGEVFWAYPFQRPARGGHFGFQLAPGW